MYYNHEKAPFLFALFALLIVMFFSGCGSTPDHYTSEELGWTIDIPDNWKISDDFDFADDTILKHLIGFQKGDQDFFMASYSSSGTIFADYKEGKGFFFRDGMIAMIEARGEKVECRQDSSTMGTKKFAWDYCVSHNAQGEIVQKFIFITGKVTAKKVMWVTIHYTDDKKRDEMLEAFNSSKFTS